MKAVTVELDGAFYRLRGTTWYDANSREVPLAVARRLNLEVQHASTSSRAATETTLALDWRLCGQNSWKAGMRRPPSWTSSDRAGVGRVCPRRVA